MLPKSAPEQLVIIRPETADVVLECEDNQRAQGANLPAARRGEERRGEERRGEGEDDQRAQGANLPAARQKVVDGVKRCVRGVLARVWY